MRGSACQESLRPTVVSGYGCETRLRDSWQVGHTAHGHCENLVADDLRPPAQNSRHCEQCHRQGGTSGWALHASRQGPVVMSTPQTRTTSGPACISIPAKVRRGGGQSLRADDAEQSRAALTIHANFLMKSGEWVLSAATCLRMTRRYTVGMMKQYTR